MRIIESQELGRVRLRRRRLDERRDSEEAREAYRGAEESVKLRAACTAVVADVDAHGALLDVTVARQKFVSNYMIL